MMAENASKMLTKEKVAKLNQSEIKVKEDLCAYVFSKLPEHIKKAFNDSEIKPYLRCTSQVRLIGCGFNYDYFSVDKIPLKNDDNSHYVSFENGDKFGMKFFKQVQDNKIEKARLEKLVQDIEQALINMKTLKRVSVEFPEAMEFLPKSEITAICVSVEPIRQELKK